jgi:hypothetical protein
MTPHEIAAGLTKAQREALIQLADEPSPQGFLISEGRQDDITARQMMELGLVAFIRAGGLVLISMMPLGQQVRAILEQQHD